MDKIILPQINICACHGVEAAERVIPQDFSIRVELSLDLQPAAVSDDVADTVHYGQLCAAIKGLAELESYRLIETLAQQVARLCLAYERVSEVRVSVTKLNAAYAGLVFPATVEVTRSR